MPSSHAPKLSRIRLVARQLHQLCETAVPDVTVHTEICGGWNLASIPPECLTPPNMRGNGSPT